MAENKPDSLVQESFVRANPESPIYGATGSDRAVGANLMVDRYDPRKGYTTREYAPEIFSTASDEAQRQQANASVAQALESPVQKIESDVNAMQDQFFQEEVARTNTVPTSTAIEGEVVTGQPKSGVMSALESANKMIEDQRSAYLSLEAEYKKNKRPEMSFEQAYRSLMEEQGYTAEQNKLTTVQKDISDAEARLRDRVQAQYANGEIPLGVIAGRVGEVERQEMQRIDFLRRTEKNIMTSLQQKESVINNLMKAKGTDYQNAIAAYEDQYKQALKSLEVMGGFSEAMVDVQMKIAQEEERIAQMKDKQKAEEAKAQLELRKQEEIEKAKMRDDARANLQILYNNVISGGINTAELSPGEKLDWARLEAQSGLPVGTFVQMAAKNNGFEMVGTGSARYDDSGNKFMDFIMRNPRTGEMRIETKAMGYDADKALDMENSRSLIDDRTASRLNAAKPKEGSYWANYGSEVLGSPHKEGIDLDGKIGDPIYAPVSGKVISVKTEQETGGKKGWGNQVIIEDANGFRHLLNHLDGFNVRVGDSVSAGQAVATMGNTGNVIPLAGGDGSHLDLTIKRPDGSMLSRNQARQYIDKVYKPFEEPKKTKFDVVKDLEEAFTSVLSGRADINYPSSKYIDPEIYKQMKLRAQLEDGISEEVFDSQFGKYKDPAQSLQYK